MSPGSSPGPRSSLMFSRKRENLILAICCSHKATEPQSHSPNNYCNIFMAAGTPGHTLALKLGVPIKFVQLYFPGQAGLQEPGPALGSTSSPATFLPALVRGLAGLHDPPTHHLALLALLGTNKHNQANYQSHHTTVELSHWSRSIQILCSHWFNLTMMVLRSMP